MKFYRTVIEFPPMTPDEPLFAAFSMAICQAVVGNLIEIRAGLNVLVQRGLLSAHDIENSKQQMPSELARSLEEEIYTAVMKTMQEQYLKLLSGPKGPIQ